MLYIYDCRLTERIEAELITRYPPWTARSDTDSEDGAKNHCFEIWRRLKAGSSAERLEFLLDTRGIHKQLFGKSTPVGFENYAGHYRGEDFIYLKERKANISSSAPFFGGRRNVSFIAPEFVAQEMDFLASKLLVMPYQQGNKVVDFFNCVAIFRRFIAIHPYLNGNGRIARLQLALLADMHGIECLDSWNFYRRPYDHFFGFCFDQYDTNPHVLTAYLSRWFS